MKVLLLYKVRRVYSVKKLWRRESTMVEVSHPSHIFEAFEEVIEEKREREKAEGREPFEDYILTSFLPEMKGRA